MRLQPLSPFSFFLPRRSRSSSDGGGILLITHRDVLWTPWRADTNPVAGGGGGASRRTKK